MDVFDASKVTPQQGVGGHPPGMFPFQITNTYAKENSAKTGGMLVVELTSDVGKIENRYNLWNPSEAAMRIAQGELAALCHATGIFKISFPKDPAGNPISDQAGRELRGGIGRMEVVPQLDKNGQPNGYMEVKTIFDKNGNAPGKHGSAPQPQGSAQGGGAQWGNVQPQQQPNQNTGQQPNQNSAPMTQSPGGNWGGGNPNPPANNPPANPPAGGWQQNPQGGSGPAPWNK